MAEATLTSQEYAIRVFQLLHDYPSEHIKIDTIIVLVKMLTNHAVENAVMYATGDPFQFGALEFENRSMAESFLTQISDIVAYAAFLDGEFLVYQYPYRSRVLREWKFVDLKSKSEDFETPE
jgi:hypothetical protein